MAIDYFADLETNARLALSEDRGDGDISAQLIDANTHARAHVITRESAVICGVNWVNAVLRLVDPGLKIAWMVADGEHVTANQVLYSLSGKARSLLTAERPAMNFLQTLSGTATRTYTYSRLIAHTKTRLLDTRKTIPGLRRAQKYAVKCGGGYNHRMGLYDSFLIKENHILACGSVTAAIRRAKSLYADRRIEVEVENLNDYAQVLTAKPHWIMLDNFSLDDMRTAVKNRPNHIKLEASGGIESDAALITTAETGVDYISSGSLTKHCRAIDLSMSLSGHC